MKGDPESGRHMRRINDEEERGVEKEEGGIDDDKVGNDEGGIDDNEVGNDEGGIEEGRLTTMTTRMRRMN